MKGLPVPKDPKKGPYGIQVYLQMVMVRSNRKDIHYI